MADLKKMLQKETLLRKAAEGETNNLKIQVVELRQSEVCYWVSSIYMLRSNTLSNTLSMIS